MLTDGKYCDCNAGELDNLPQPLFRLVCHCKTCQQFFGAAYNDECTFLLRECKDVNLSNVEFKGYQKGYSPIKRGICKRCGKISHCTVKFGPFAEYLMVSSERLGKLTLPQPFAHIYYHSRQSDIETGIKKIGGHVRSQFAILWAVVKSFFRQQR